jgi:hypothetical protein
MQEWRDLLSRSRDAVAIPAETDDRWIRLNQAGSRLDIVVLDKESEPLASATLDRERVQWLRDELTRWLESAPPDPVGAGTPDA